MRQPTDHEIANLPKVELHRHLEGSMRLATVRDLACESGIVLPASLSPHATDPTDARWHFDDFEDFLVQYAVACSTLTTPDHFHRIALELVEDLARERIRYAEVTFTPTGHARRLGSWCWPLQAVLTGLHEGRERYGVVVALILDHSREQAPELALDAARLAVAHVDHGIVALGLGGDEAHPPERFTAAFEFARCAGLPAVIHAGETMGPESILGALDALGAVRIGHGIRALDDPALVDRLVGESIPLEVCPTSNLRTGVVGSIEEHPWPRMVDAGLTVTLNSDDPTMFGSDLGDEMRLVRDTFGLDHGALAALTRTALEHSFAPPAVRESIERELGAWAATITDDPA